MGQNEIKREIKKYALRLLALRDYTTGQLREKIGARFPGEYPEEIIAALAGAGYLSDEKFAARLAEKWLRQERGLWRIIADLQRRGFAPEIIASVKDGFDYDGEYAAARRAFKKLRARKSVPAALRALAARGFSARTIGKTRYDEPRN